MGALARAEGGAATTAAIRWFIKRYGVDMVEAANSNPAAYSSFNNFFTRELKAGARPLSDTHGGRTLLCPVDGAISQFGAIEGDQIFQAKGHRYSTTALVGGDSGLAAYFQNGHFATLYLSPKDYHRIHMPCAGRLLRMIHVPGALFSVNPATARGVPGLFARNERVVCVFEGERGPWVLVLVGATVVGSMATTWQGVVRGERPGLRHALPPLPGLPPLPPLKPREWAYHDQDIRLRAGDEMGRFLLGSTVVLLLPPHKLAWNLHWGPGGAIRMGERMADWL
jgi:phosphatidylserine decarboxylase